MKEYKISQIENKRVLGRTYLNCKNKAAYQNEDNPVTLFWGASAVEINVKSNEVWALISADYSDQKIWVSVEVNGFQIARFIAPKEKTWIQLSCGMNPQNENLISIYKDCQPMPGDNLHCLNIHSIGLYDNGEFCKINPRKLNIEFIGDSITSGEGLAGNPDEMDWITQWMCASKSYAAQVSKELNADFSTISQCGWGICWGWDGNLNNKIPPYYNKVCGLLWGEGQKAAGCQEDYDFSVKNDYVVLNLGTNDNGAFFQPAWKDENGKEYKLSVDENQTASKEDGEKISSGVYEFLKDIRKNNPDAKIIWTWGMIKLVAAPYWISDGVNRFKKDFNDENVYLLELGSMEELEKCDADKGSRGHPGSKVHKLAAEKITEFIRNLM